MVTSVVVFVNGKVYVACSRYVQETNHHLDQTQVLMVIVKKWLGLLRMKQRVQ